MGYGIRTTEYNVTMQHAMPDTPKFYFKTHRAVPRLSEFGYGGALDVPLGMAPIIAIQVPHPGPSVSV